MDAKSENMITIIEAIAQAENEARSQNTRWGIVKRAKDGTSGLYKRRCFGYYTDKEGDLQINDIEAEVVRDIFSMYLAGESLVGIIRRLEKDAVKTATGKDTWSKNTLDKLLSNEKYCGNAEIFKTFTATQFSPVKTKTRKVNNGELARYTIIENHPAIIAKETFDSVQTEKLRRSNVERTAVGAMRKSTRYSSKRDSTAV